MTKEIKSITNFPNWLLSVLTILSLVGFADAVYLTIEHYSNTVPPCTLQGCESVLTSAYSSIWGVPIALLGAIYYFALILLYLFYFFKNKNSVLTFALRVSILGFLADLWFVYAQAFLVHAWCQYCLLSILMSTLIFILSYWALIKKIKVQKGENIKILRIINPDKVGDDVIATLIPRLAARGVVFNEDNKVALLHVSKHDYFKLPGGGIEKGEDKLEAFRRECIEEIGYDVVVISALGSIVEYRSKFGIIQTSFCYSAKVIGDRKETAFTPHEIAEGFEEPIWVPFDEALRLVTTSNPNDYEGNFIKERDTLILQTAANK